MQKKQNSLLTTKSITFYNPLKLLWILVQMNPQFKGYWKKCEQTASALARSVAKELSIAISWYPEALGPSTAYFK